jgi:Uma2 family endonuclease
VQGLGEGNPHHRNKSIDDQLIPVPGTTRFHNIIFMNNLAYLMRLLLHPDQSNFFQENVKVQIIPRRNYAYPDLAVTKETRDLMGEDAYFVEHPTATFEVLSKNSRIEDQADKFIRYQNIESLRDCVLVDSERQWVEVRSKTFEGQWEFAAYGPKDDKVAAPSLGIELPFSDIYQGTPLG